MLLSFFLCRRPSNAVHLFVGTLKKNRYPKSQKDLWRLGTSVPKKLKQNKYSPQHISLGVSLKGSKSIFDFDKVKPILGSLLKFGHFYTWFSLSSQGWVKMVTKNPFGPVSWWIKMGTTDVLGLFPWGVCYSDWIGIFRLIWAKRLIIGTLKSQKGPYRDPLCISATVVYQHPLLK